MLITLLGLFGFVILVFTIFLGITLPGFPSGGPNDRLVNIHELRKMCPDLHETYFNIFQRAVNHHLVGEFDQAVHLYEQLRVAKLVSGSSVNLFEVVPALQANISSARQRRR